MKPVICTNGEMLGYDELNDEWEPMPDMTFTKREQDIARLTIQGLSEEEIATGLCISSSAIKQCKQHLFDKLGVRNMQEAIAFASNYRLF